MEDRSGRNRTHEREKKGKFVQVLDEDVERLSPLAHSYINMLGRYHFTLPEEVLRGQLRPLRDPSDPDEILNASSVTG